MKALSIWKNDIKEILKSSYMTVAVIAIILIPLVYGGLYLAAFWDPYGSTDKLPVVVVNQDTGYTNDDGDSLQYGKDVVNSLKYNDDLGWVFEDDLSKAEEGLLNEGYYAMFIIPKDFSQTLNGVREGHLIQPIIQYIPNEKKNYIVSLINNKASGAIENSVSKSMSGVFTSVVFEQLEYLKDKINTGTEAVYLLEDGVSKLNMTVPKLQDGLEKVNDGTTVLEEKLGDASDGVTTLNDAVTSLNDKLPDLLDGTEKIYKGSETFNEKLGEAYDGTNSLGDALASYHDKLPEVQEATEALTEASGQINDSLDTLSDKSKDVTRAIETISNGLDELLEGITEASDGSEDLTEKFESIEAGINKLSYMQISPIIDSLSNLSFSDNTKKEEYDKSLHKLASTLEAIGVADGTNIKLEIEKPEFVKAVNSAKTSLLFAYNYDYYGFERKQYMADPTAEFNKAMGEVSGRVVAFEKDLNAVNVKMIPVIGYLTRARVQVDASYKGAVAINNPDIAGDMHTLLNTIDSTLNKLQAPTYSRASLLELIGGKVGVQAYSVSNKSLSTGLSESAVVGLDKLTDGSHELKKSMPKFEGAVTLLSKYSGYLNQNVEKLNAKVPDLEQGMALIDDNVLKLNSGVLKLNAASEKMLEGAEELNAKVPDLQTGVELIGEGTTKIEEGVVKLHSASGLLNEGVTTLNEKMPDLLDGVNALYDGTGNLASQLNTGSDLISDAVVVDGNAMSAYIANPVVVDTNAIYEVENYGTGFAPYFIALALWVGALTMFFIIPDKRKEGDSAKDYVFGKYFTYATVGIIQAIILSIVIIAIGLRPDSYVFYFMFNIMLSLVFIAIMQCLIYLFSDAGRLGATVFLLLQLTSCGGTFSVELVPPFFQKVSPFMPFTYAITGLREIISGVNASVLLKSSLILVIIQVFALIILYFGMNYKDKSQKNKSSKMEENLLPVTD